MQQCADGHSVLLIQEQRLGCGIVDAVSEFAISCFKIGAHHQFDASAVGFDRSCHLLNASIRGVLAKKPESRGEIVVHQRPNDAGVQGQVCIGHVSQLVQRTVA